MEKKRTRGEESSVTPERRSRQQENGVLPASDDVEMADAAHVHVEYAEQLPAPSDAHAFEQPMRRIPPTPAGDDVGDADPSPPIQVQPRSDSAADAKSKRDDRRSAE